MFKLFEFFGPMAKFCILQALVSILTIGFGKKIKTMQFLIIFYHHFKNAICIILTFFLFFWLSWSQEMTFYIFIMAVAHICEQEKKKWKFWFFLKIWKFENFQKKSKFSFFLSCSQLCPTTMMGIWKVISWLQESQNNKKRVKIMYITSLKWRSKMTKNCIFFYFFFPKPIANIVTCACKMQIFAM